MLVTGDPGHDKNTFYAQRHHGAGLAVGGRRRVDVLKTAKMAKNATLLTFTGPSFGLFALFEVTECGSETDRTRRGCELVVRVDE